MKKAHGEKGTYRLKKRLIGSLAVFFALSTVIFVLASSLYSRRLLANFYDTLSHTTDIYATLLETNIAAIQSAIHSFANNNTDIGSLAALRDWQDTIPYQIRVKELLSSAITYSGTVDGLFVYAGKTDVFIAAFSAEPSLPFSMYLKEQLRGNDSSAASFAREHSRTWHLVEVAGIPYLLLTVNSSMPDCYLGTWVSLASLVRSFSGTASSPMAFYTSMDGVPPGTPSSPLVFYTTPEGVPLGAPGNSPWRDVHINLTESGGFNHVRGPDGVRYLRLVRRLAFCDLPLVLLVPQKNITEMLFPMFAMVLVFTLALIAASAVVFLSLTRLVSRPLTVIQEVAEKIKLQDENPRFFDGSERCEEVLDITRSINYLLDEVDLLHMNVYQAEFAKKELELSTLKSQVAPHFLINCLSAIHAMPATEEGFGMMRRLTETLSKHVRYTLSSQADTTLGEELSYVENYLELTSLRFPGFLHWNISVPPEVLGSMVPPMLILCFSENAVKHNMVMGEHFTVGIVCEEIAGTTPSVELTTQFPAWPVETNAEAALAGAGTTTSGAGRSIAGEARGKRFLRIVHTDDGEGIPPELLERLNAPVGNEPLFKDGSHTGVYNILKRLELTYGGEASVTFSNKPGGGTRIEVEIPYREPVIVTETAGTTANTAGIAFGAGAAGGGA